MIPLRLLGLGAAAFAIGGCTQPAPVVNVTVIMQQPALPRQAKVEPEQRSLPTAINRPLPVAREWGDPLPWRDDGEVYQVEVCKARMGGLGAGCFSYGAPVDDKAGCEPVKAQAEIDFPFEFYGCARVYRSDLEAPQGLPVDKT